MDMEFINFLMEDVIKDIVDVTKKAITEANNAIKNFVNIVIKGFKELCSWFVQEIEKNLPPGQAVTWSRMDKPHPVSGVGNDTVFAKWRVKVPIRFPGGDVTSYNGMYPSWNDH